MAFRAITSPKQVGKQRASALPYGDPLVPASILQRAFALVDQAIDQCADQAKNALQQTGLGDDNCFAIRGLQ
jgi:hypothetical protein